MPLTQLRATPARAQTDSMADQARPYLKLRKRDCETLTERLGTFWMRSEGKLWLCDQPLAQLTQPATCLGVIRLLIGARLAFAVVVAAADTVEARVGDQPEGRLDALLKARDST